MARKPISMRKARNILRLKYEAGLGVREIGRSLHIPHSTVVNYLQRAKAAGVGWPLPEHVDDKELSDLLLGCCQQAESAARPLPDMAQIYKHLHDKRRCKGLTRMLLWEEYRAGNPDGYGYTQFCEYYRRFVGSLEPSLRQPYKAGEKLFVDWAGETMPVVDQQSGTVRRVHLFVATLGASNYTYAEAFEDTRQASWIEAHIRAWEFFGGVTAVTVPDNEKTGVDNPCRYEPVINRTYEELAEHYGTVIIPARGAKPKDKAKVEKAVQDAERRIVAVLRNRKFFSLAELNAAVRQALDAFNCRGFQKMPGCRRELFEQLDKPALRPLPQRRYDPGEWRKAKVNIDYHIQIDWHCYSVPHQLANQGVEVRLSVRSVEVFHHGKRVALHARSNKRGGFTTDAAHRPKSHQRHLEWTPARLISWAGNEVGAQCAATVTRLLNNKPHPEQGYRACLGIMRLRRHYGVERLEAACRRAVVLDACTYRSIKSMLATGVDRQEPGCEHEGTPTVEHNNIRGQEYYQ